MKLTGQDAIFWMAAECGLSRKEQSFLLREERAGRFTAEIEIFEGEVPALDLSNPQGPQPTNGQIKANS